ncbi:MAG: hypothetical protein RLZZ618_1152 [Pseudomonadota bacterium]|jgi:glutathione-regulated potassium-efflux system ancillary protein KefF
MTAPADILVITAHPHMEQSKITRALMEAATGVKRVAVRDLYSLYPDYLIDTAAEQAALAEVKLVVWQHPIYWYHMPPLMKLWLDEVLTFGWAYGPGGHALQGKDLWLVTSTGGPETSYSPDNYNRYSFDAFLPAYEQTAALCGMRFLPPMVVHGANHVSEADVAERADMLVQRLRAYPDWPEMDELPECVVCDVPFTARPADALVRGG